MNRKQKKSILLVAVILCVVFIVSILALTYKSSCECAGLRRYAMNRDDGKEMYDEEEGASLEAPIDISTTSLHSCDQMLQDRMNGSVGFPAASENPYGNNGYCNCNNKRGAPPMKCLNCDKTCLYDSGLTEYVDFNVTMAPAMGWNNENVTPM